MKTETKQLVALFLTIVVFSVIVLSPKVESGRQKTEIQNAPMARRSISTFNAQLSDFRALIAAYERNLGRPGLNRRFCPPCQQ